MTPSELKYHIEQTGEEPYFFDRKTMKFFGDTMANFGCRMTVVATNDGEDVPCYELYRKRAVKHGLRSSHYFRRDTFAQVYNVKHDYNRR